jgi:hypothetical protein
MGRVAMSRRVSCIPSADRAFCDAATTALARLDGQLGDDAIEAALRKALLPSYPRVGVHRQAELVRLSGTPTATGDPMKGRPPTRTECLP